MESIFFTASEPFPAGTPLRIVVPAVAAAEDLLLAAARSCATGCAERRLALGADGPDAELALLDHWTDLPRAERSRVWGVVGAFAGALMRFDDRPSLGFAVLGSPALARGRGNNPQSRSLLMADHPDTWTLALDDTPGVDADEWRFRLSTVLRQRWEVGLLERPADVRDRFVEALRVDPSSASPHIAWGVAPPSTSVPPTARAADWLDSELHARLAGAPENHVDRVTFGGSPSPAAPSAIPADAEQKVLRGKHGRLFLAQDSHDSHRQIIGERPLADDELDAWQRGTASRIEDLGSYGCLLIHLIGPAPQVVHSADLPDSVSVSSARPARQVLERLAAMQPAPEVIYPLADLEAVRALQDPFSKTDSHWNDLGAYVAYEAVKKQLGDRLPIRSLRRDEVIFQETCYVGDLGVKLRPQRAGTFLRARIERPRARLVEDNRVRNHGRVAIYACDAAPPTSCLVYGDSWAYPMLLYLAESFRRVVFFHRVNVIDREPIRRERPDLVLMILTERFCSALPNDRDAIAFERVIAKKMRARDLVPETAAPTHRHPFLHSVKLDRGLPDRAGFRLPPG